MLGSKSVEDILMKDELDDLVRAAHGRLRLVHVVGDTAEAGPPQGWRSSETFTAEAGWIDRAKVSGVGVGGGGGGGGGVGELDR